MKTVSGSAGNSPTSQPAGYDAGSDDRGPSDNGKAPPGSGQAGAHAPPLGPQANEDGYSRAAADAQLSDQPAGQRTDDYGPDSNIQNPDLKRLSDEAAKYRNRAKAAEEALVAADATIRELRIQNEFQRYALPLVDDLDAAWKLADHSLVKVSDDGDVTGIREMLQSLVRSYPYLERQPDTTPYHVPGSGGTPANGRRAGTSASSRAVLEKKFPALRSRGW
jgi:hypothetical protein